MIFLDSPPASLGTRDTPLATHELRISYLEYGPAKYWVEDHVGFLCSCDSLKDLGTLLAKQSESHGQHPSGSKADSKYFWVYGAREWLFPGSALARKKYLEEMYDATQAVLHARPSCITPSEATAKARARAAQEVSLESLGL